MKGLSDYTREIKFLEGIAQIENSLENYKEMLVEIMNKEVEYKGKDFFLEMLNDEKQKIECLIIETEYKLKFNEIYLRSVDITYRDLLKDQFINNIYKQDVCEKTHLSISTVRRYTLAGLEQLRVALEVFKGDNN